MMTVRDKLVQAVTAFDRAQEAKAAKNPRAYYNTYALAQYLGRVADIMDDIDAGAPVDEAIWAGFTSGPLRKACLKACGYANSASETHGHYKGMPVYRKVTS